MKVIQKVMLWDHNVVGENYVKTSRCTVTGLDRTSEHMILKMRQCLWDGQRGKGFYNQHPSQDIEDKSTILQKQKPYLCMNFPGGSVIKKPPANEGDSGLNPESGRFPGEGTGSSFQYSCLDDPQNRGAWQATIHGVAKSRTWLSG